MYKPTKIEGPHKTFLEHKKFVIVRYMAGTKVLARFPYLSDWSDEAYVPKFVEKEEDAMIFSSTMDVYATRDRLSNDRELGWLRQFTFQILITNVHGS